MHSSRKRRDGSRRRLAALLAILATSANSFAASAEGDLATLLQEFATMPGFSARFREERRIALLQAPLVSEGTLHFVPPDRLARHIEKPVASTVVLSGRTLTIREGESERSIDLETSPAVGSLIDGIRLLLAGDHKALSRLYDLAMHGDDEHRWTLRMVPRGAPLTDLVREIEVSGLGPNIDRLRVSERSGDESLSVFSDVDTKHPLDAAKRLRFFGAPPP